MSDSTRQLPEEPRPGGAPHPTVAAHAATVVGKSREFDRLVDRLSETWTMTAAE
eukprot:CAMPEP_0197409520 /NCGR_PEP_ID=MMETSP1165-20131217/30043_1 /TAXON_ID=284809 /ORGANISM="Chrysocystis fragilis, Strain CCMP3189" /LENGTH=53 /DNA_ID=CAMNT_0042935985 /DNA_START=30 /DNA_END=188 /DNA_ORIENTATION=+